MEEFYFQIEDECDFNLQEVEATLFSSNDPKSYYYKRILIRPSVPWKKIIAWLAGLGLVCLLSLLIRAFVKFSPVLILIYLLFSLKWIAKTLIIIYQHYAPDYVRNNCRYEPSCSVYMTKSIDKYGLVKGAIRGIKRLHRCRHGGGGFEEP